MNRHEIISKFKEFKLLVVGDLMADKYVWGEATRLSSEAPVPIINVHYHEYKLGGAANVANNVRNLGAHVYLCGLVGYDDAAYWFRKVAREGGIDTSGVFPSNDRPTTLKVRVMSATYNSQFLRMDYESVRPLPGNELATIKKFIESYIPSVDALIFSDYEKGIFSDEEFVHHLLYLADEAQIITVADCKPRHLTYFKNSSLVTMSLKEAEEFSFFELRRKFADPEKLGSALIDLLECKALALLSGDEEILTFQQDGKKFRYPILKKGLHDVIGLRDTIVSTLALSLIAGCDVQAASELANLAACKVLGKIGTATITADELIEN